MENKYANCEDIRVVGIVYETRNYEMFEFYKGNRNINPIKVKNTLRSFNERYYPVQIVTDEEHNILEGQLFRTYRGH